MKSISLLSATLFLFYVLPTSAPLAPNAAAADLSGQTPVERFHALRDVFQSKVLEFTPESAVDLGLKVSEPRLSDLSQESLQAQKEFYGKLSGELGEIEPFLKRFSSEDRLDFELLKSAVSYQRHYLEDWQGQLRDMGSFGAGLAPSSVVQSALTKAAPATAEADWKSILAHVRGIPTYLRQHEANLRRGLELGFRPDKRILDVEIEEAKEAANFFENELKVKPAQVLTGDRARSAENEAASAGTDAAAAYRNYAEFLQRELVPHAGETFALGEKEYAWRLRQMGIRETPQQVHQKGLELAEQIRRRMTQLARQIAPDKDLAAVMQDLNGEYPRNDQELLQAYKQQTLRAQKFVEEKGIFDIPAGYKLQIIETPKSMRGVISKAAYFPAPPLDPSRHGAFMVTPSEGDQGRLQFHNYSTIPTVAVHEAFPGHDLQYYSFQQRDKNASRLVFFTDAGFGKSLNIEGYALYAEELMRRQGFYSPKEELSQLRMQLWRAYRIIIDTAIHTGKMGFDEAAKTLQEAIYTSLPAASSEVLRYSMIPTQAVTYFLGRLQIEAIKEDYQKTMGPDYSERAFHKAFLEFGPVPPGYIAPLLLERAKRERGSVN